MSMTSPTSPSARPSRIGVYDLGRNTGWVGVGTDHDTAALGLDLDRFTTALREHAGALRVAEDVDSADLSGVSGTPTFFINGRRHYGAYDIATLSAAVRAAGVRAALATPTAD
jgi:2-hydroxychromene-2-carboxylate isomerase